MIDGLSAEDAPDLVAADCGGCGAAVEVTARTADAGVETCGDCPDDVLDVDGYRRDSEITDDLARVLPPDVEPRGDVPAAVFEAAQQAIRQEPNVAKRPILHGPGGFDVPDHAVAVLTVNVQEIPGSSGFQPPYVSREKLVAALRDHLDVDRVEEKNRSQIILYGEGGR